MKIVTSLCSNIVINCEIAPEIITGDGKGNMKVKLLTDGYDEYTRIELTVKKRKKIITISSLAEDKIELQSDYLASGVIKYALPSSYTESGITVVWAKNKHDLIDFRKEIDKEEPDIVSYGNNMTTYMQRDTEIFELELVDYCITKEE